MSLRLIVTEYICDPNSPVHYINADSYSMMGVFAWNDVLERHSEISGS